MKRIALFLAFTFAGLAAQPSRPRPEFVLGASYDELHQAFGAPTMYWSVEAKRYLATVSEAAAARAIGHRVIDVYRLKTARNAYEFRPAYQLDASQSRLHPTKRISDVVFELDRPVADVETLLADFPEAATLCARECTIYVANKGYYGVFVQPTNPSAGELQEAASLRSQWGSQTMVDLLQESENLNQKLATALQKSYHPSVPAKTIALKLEGQKITGGIFDVEDAVGTGRTYLDDYTKVGTWKGGR
jgi:hypothetical protein